MQVLVSIHIVALGLLVVNGQPTMDQSYSNTCTKVEWTTEKILNLITERKDLCELSVQTHTPPFTGTCIFTYFIQKQKNTFKEYP